MKEAAKAAREKTRPVHIATTTITALTERNITPSPENYTVWYYYVSGEPVALRKSLDSQLASNPAFGDKEMAALYETFFGLENQNKAIESIREQLIGELKSLLEGLSGAQSTSGSYTESLEALSSALSVDKDPSDLQPVISAVAQATQKMASENLSLGHRLTRSTSEITQLKAELEDMRLQAMTDGLTGIANRKCFDIELENAIEFADQENAAVSLLMVDVDHFKKFNDTYGHLAGDQVLKLLADILKETVKGRDIPARFGGEEFSIILPETELAGAVGLAESLRSRIVRRPLVNKMTGSSLGSITISIGATQYIPEESPEDFVARADKALYGAKASGRDQVVAG